MKLNKEQLQQINDFISKRGFAYHDLKLEILDHVACRVEELMTADPTLPLNDAIAMTHAGFGVHGFSVFEDAMRASLQKRYWKLFLHRFAACFKPLYLPLQIASVYLIYMLVLNYSRSDWPINVAWIACCGFLVIFALITYRRQQKHKPMLTAQMGGIMAVLINIPIQLCIYVPNHLHRFSAGVTGIIIGVFLTVLATLFISLLQTQKIALAQCEVLDDQYRLTVGE